MGHIGTTVDRSRDLAVRTVSGMVTAAEIRSAITEGFDGRAPRRILWDLTRAALGEVSTDDLRALISVTQAHTAVRLGGKSALVFSEDYTFGLGRLFATHMELAKDPVAHRAFRDAQEAMEWLMS